MKFSLATATKARGFIISMLIINPLAFVAAYSSNLYVTALGYKNHKSCKILPKFLPTLHFLQESYKFVRESQFLQDWYIALYFLQDFCKNFAKFAYFIQKFLQNLRFSF